MKLLALGFFTAMSAATGADDKASICPVQGETIHWIADFCMATIGTDDEIAASDCISEQGGIRFRSDCEAKMHFKRTLCELSIERRTYAGTVKACINDPRFVGETVRNDGVGAR